MTLKKTLKNLHNQGKDFTNLKSLIDAIRNEEIRVSKDELLDYLVNNKNLHVHATPNYIAQFISNMATQDNTSNAVDICCGTGNILYFLQNNIDDLTGVEINSDIVEITSYFIPEIKIIKANTFYHDFTRKYDLVVGCVPFGFLVEFNGKKIKSEEAFVRKALEICSDNGEVIMVLPTSLLENSMQKAFRNEFVSHLNLVIELPIGAIVYTNVATSIVRFSKQVSSQVSFGKVDAIESFNKPLQSMIFKTINTKEVVDRWDAAFFEAQDKSIYKELDSQSTKELSELAEVVGGKYIKAENLDTSGDYLYLKPTHIHNSNLKLEKALKYVSNNKISAGAKNGILREGDILVSTIFNELKLYIYKKNDPPAITSNNMAIIRSNIDDYIITYLKTKEGLEVFSEQAKDSKTGSIIPHLSLSSIKSIRIPLIPIADLNKLGNHSIESSDTNELEELKAQIFRLKNELKSQGELRHFLNDRFNKVDNQLSVVNKKIDTVLEMINSLSNDFSSIKGLPRNDEEKLFKLYKSLDTKLESIKVQNAQTIEGYVSEIKQWLNDWDLLDEESKTFLPIAEFLYDELSKIESADVDYSPFVVQYCRTLENEVLKKLFEEYHSKGLVGIDRKNLTESALLNKNTSRFAEMVNKDSTLYPLGTMHFILSLLKEGCKTLKQNVLLQHFREFVVEYFEDEILQKDFLEDMKKINENFRNKAAHPNIIGVDSAMQCQKLLRKNLMIFLDNLRAKTEK